MLWAASIQHRDGGGREEDRREQEQNRAHTAPVPRREGHDFLREAAVHSKSFSADVVAGVPDRKAKIRHNGRFLQRAENAAEREFMMMMALTTVGGARGTEDTGLVRSGGF